jgi:adenylate cyclase
MQVATRKRLLQALVVAAFSLLLLFTRVIDPGILGTLRGAGFDTLQRIWPRQQSEPQPVRIVDIDEASLKEIGQWPWPRMTLAKLVDGLTELGAAAVVFDIVFPENDRMSPRSVLASTNLDLSLLPARTLENLPDSDAVFAASLSNRPTIGAFASTKGGTLPEALPTKAGQAQTGASALEAAPRTTSVTANIPQINNAVTGLGIINLDLAGEQGVARQIPMLWSDGKKFLPSLVPEALRVAQGVDTYLINGAADTENALESLRIGDIEIPMSENGQFYVYYRPNSPSLYVSAADVLNGSKRASLRDRIEGNIVFIGTSATGLLDVRTTALGEPVPGVSVHAQATEQVLAGQFLSRPEWIVSIELIGTLLGGLAIAWAGAFYRPLASYGIATAAVIAILAATTLLFKKSGLLFDATFPAIALTLTYLASTAYRLIITDREGRSMRRMFAHYVAPSVLANIEQNPESLKLGGEVRDVTVMFVDIANFTPLSEKLPPEQLVQTVNGLWNACSGAILSEQGTIDKFIGDAIMAFWNAPVDLPHHQTHALRAALGIRRAVKDYNARPDIAALLSERGIPPIGVRVGLASGPACVGNMGTDDRFDYSVLGETVNTAARTESSCKKVGHDILIAGELRGDSKSLALLAAGHTSMKGKSQLEPIHAVLGDETLKDSVSFKELAKEHDHIISKLATNPKKAALATLTQLLDEMARHHAECANYLRTLANRVEDFAVSSQSK